MKRRAFKLVVILLLGAIVNFAVALGVGLYGISATKSFESAFNPISDGTLVSVTVRKTRCTTIAVLSPVSTPHANGYATFQNGSPDDLIPSWCNNPERYERFREAAALYPSEHVMARNHVVGIGWPLRSIWYEAGELVMYGNNVYHTSGDPRTQELALNFERLIGMRPIWSGFVVNSMIWAFILWMLFILNPALHRRVRIKSGLCPACSYPIGQSPTCTECGAFVEPRRGDGL